MSNNENIPGAWCQAGDRIGTYQVRRRLAVGRQAIVYLCHDSLLDRDVAVKQIPAHLGAGHLEQVRQRVQVLARLGAQQPAIVTIHELLEDPRGLFVVMEVFPGRSLEAMLLEGPGPSDPKAAIQIIWRVAGVLRDAHAAGVVHGDLRPSNILVGEGLRVKITDFATAVDVQGDGASAYTAPELLAGGAPSAASDQYALGMIAYEMFLGRARFAQAFAEVLADGGDLAARWRDWHADRQARAPLLHEVLGHLPASLSLIVARMMAKDPPERFADMEQLGRAIRASFSPKRSGGAGLPAPADLADQEEMLAISRHLGPTGAAPHAPQAEAPVAPRRAMGTRARVGLAVTAAALVLVAGLGVLVVVSVQHQRGLARAQQVYDSAMELYRQGQYEVAAGRFKQLAHDYPTAAPAQRADGLADLARAAAALRTQQWQQATEDLGRVRGQLTTRPAGDDPKAQWMAQQLEALSAQLTAARALGDALASARLAMDAGQFEQARSVLRTKLEGLDLDASQRDQLARFGGELEAAGFKGEFNRALASADQAAGSADQADAQAALQLAQAMLESSTAQALAPGDVQSLQELLTAAGRHLQASRELDQAMQRADQAQQSGSPAEQLAALEAAQQARPDPQRAQHILELKVQLALSAAQEQIQRGDLEQAQAALQAAMASAATTQASQPATQSAVAAAPQTQPAALAQVGEQLQRVQALIRRRDLMHLAESKLAAGKPAEALVDLEAARAVLDDQEIQDRIRAVQYRVALDQGDALAAQGQYDQATEAYQQARQANPAGSGEVDVRISRMSRQREFAMLMNQAQIAMTQQSWDDAVRLLTQAKGLVDSPRVNQMLIDARYGQNIQLGKRSMSRRDFNGARAYFNLSKRLKDTPEVNQLLDEAARQAAQPQ